MPDTTLLYVMTHAVTCPTCVSHTEVVQGLVNGVGIALVVGVVGFVGAGLTVTGGRLKQLDQVCDRGGIDSRYASPLRLGGRTHDATPGNTMAPTVTDTPTDSPSERWDSGPRMTII